MNTLFKLILSHKKILIILLLLIVGGIFISFKTGLLGKSPIPYKTQIVAVGNLSNIINASGQVKSQNFVTMGFLSSGRIAKVNYKEGDKIKKSEIIASLDNIQQQASVSDAQADLKSYQSALNKVLDDIHLYQYGMGGFSNIGSSSETQTQKTNREQAEMARDSAYQALLSAQKALDLTTIIAPFNGVISDISNMEIGQNVGASSGSSITLVGTEKYKFVADVDEIEFRNLSASQSGEIILDAFPDNKFTGIITSIGIAAEKLSTGGSVVPIELSLDSTEKLMNGLNGEVTFTITIKNDVITLPKTAIRKSDGAEFVYVLQNAKPVKINITTGQSLGNQTEITGGLKVGEKVILGDVKPI